MPPWYPSVAVQFEPTSKLPHQKFQYPTYVKDIDRDAHIRVLKKTIKVHGETMEAIVTNLFISFYESIFWSGVKTLNKIIPITLLKSWSKHFANIFEL